MVKACRTNSTVKTLLTSSALNFPDCSVFPCGKHPDKTLAVCGRGRDLQLGRAGLTDPEKKSLKPKFRATSSFNPFSSQNLGFRRCSGWKWADFFHPEVVGSSPHFKVCELEKPPRENV